MEEKTLESKLIFEGRVLGLKVDLIELPDGQQSAREVVVHPGAVAVVAVTEADEVLLIKQFRYPVGKVIWEIPAGKLEKGEDPLECAQRELAEETGHGAVQWTHLTTFFTTPGFSNEIMHVYLATGLFIDERTADDDEFIELHRIPLNEAVRMIAGGEIEDLKTIAGILLTLHKKHNRK